MAVLSDTDRATAWAELMRGLDNPGQVIKPDLRAAIDAADAWADANAAAYNLALPVAARTALTARQKAAVLLFVIARRYQITP